MFIYIIKYSILTPTPYDIILSAKSSYNDTVSELCVISEDVSYA